MSDYKRQGKEALAALTGAFHRPSVPLVNGVPGRAGVRYDHSPQDAAIYFAQLAAMRRVPHRVLDGREDIQGYLDEVLAMPWPRWWPGRPWEVRLTVEPGVRFAHYRSGVITLPEQVNEPVVLHEIAHHFTTIAIGHHGNRSPEFHGTGFVAAFLDLIEHVMNRAAADCFRECFAAEGLSV